MKTKNGRYEEEGNVKWYRNDKLHREDGPAYQSMDGKIRWYNNGYYHCENGPAYEDPDGTKYWFINGKELTEEEFNHLQDKKK